MEKYVKVPIYPITKFMTAKERREMPAPMKPVSFLFGDDTVYVDEISDCQRAISRRVGGRGFRYICRVNWTAKGKHRSKYSAVWFDDFLNEWFVEVPESRAPVDWYTATQLTDINDYYADGDYADE